MAVNIDFRVKNGLAVSTTATIEGTTTATSTTTGALIVTGGVGIGGNLYVGGYIYGSGNISTATNIGGGSAGQILYQTGVGATSFVGPGTSGDILVSRNSSGPTYQNTLTLAGTTAASSTNTGALQVRGGVGIGGALYVANTSYVNGSKILTAIDIETVTTLPVYITNNPALVAVSGTSTTYGTYNTGTITSILTASDYSSPGGYYGISDTATTPGYIAYIGFTTVTNFTRLVANVNYTVGSTHTIDIDLYNYITSSWDTFAVYSGTTNYYQFVLQVDSDTPYISGGVVTARFYHASFGNTAHETRIDYVALEDSIQGGQGPRGPIGPIGYTGSQGLTTTTNSQFIFSNTSTSISTSTGAVVVYGGVGIGDNLNVKGTFTLTGAASILSTTSATGASTGALTVAGGVGIGNNLYVNGNIVGLSTASSTTTVASNALYITGGVGIGKTLLVTGEAIFQSNVTFSGTSTYIYSTNTVYTDNLINIHVPVGSTGTNHSWTVDDGKDVGFIFHYYKGQDKDAFLGFANDSGYLEWYANGNESGGIFTSTEYGVFKTGGIILANTTASSSTSTGALTVAGGVGIGGNLYIGGTIFGYASVTGVITTATNIAGGGAGNLVYQSGIGTTAFVNPGVSGQLLMSSGTSAPLYVNTASIVIGNAANIAAGTAGQLVYQSSTGVTSFVGPGVSGQILMSSGTNAPLYVNTASILIGNASNIAGGTAGQLHYQSSPGVTNFVSTGSVGQLLMSSGTSAPLYVNTSSIVIGNAANIAAGTAGQIVYQSSPGVTSFVGTGTVGQLLMSSGTSAPLYVNTASIVIGNAANIAGGTAGMIPIQSGLGATAFINSGTVGYLLQMQTGNTATWVSTSSLVTAYSNTATNIAGGTAGQLHYQSSPSVTGFVSTGSVGQLLMSSGTSAPLFVNTASIVIGNAANIAGGTAGQLHYQSSTGTTGFVSTGSVGQLLMSSGTSAPLYVNTASIVIGNAANIAAGYAGLIPIQSSTGTTTFINTGTVGYLLQYQSGSTATWVSTSGLSAGNSTTATNIAGGLSGSIPIQSSPGVTTFINTGSVGNILQQQVGNTATFVSTSTLQVGYSVYANTATNIAGGTAGQLHYQSGVGVTSFVSTGTAGNVLVSNGTSAPTYNNTLTLTGTAISISTTTGALQVAGGIGVGDSIYVENRVGFVNTSNVSVVYQFYNAATNSLDTVFG